MSSNSDPKFNQPLPVAGIIVLREEHRLAIVATLNDVQRLAFDEKPSKPLAPVGPLSLRRTPREF